MNDTDLRTEESELRIGKQICFLLTAQTLILILGSINRLTHVFHGHVAANQFLRWVDFNNLLILPPLAILTSLALRQCLIKLGSERRTGIDLLFIFSVYFLGVGYGLHEITNYLSTLTRKAPGFDPGIAEIIRFNDDDFSHWIFFAAFAGQNLAILFWQSINRFQHRPRPGIVFAYLVNAFALAGGIYANLTRGEIGFDLYVLLFLAIISVWMWFRDRRQLIFIYTATGFWLGILAAGIARHAIE